jgi:hypothetical protein
MKLSAYAEKRGISYKTAWRWWKEEKLDAYQTETGTVIVREQIDAPAGIALYARVSSADQKDDLARQLERLQTYAIAKGYTVNMGSSSTAASVTYFFRVFCSAPPVTTGSWLMARSVFFIDCHRFTLFVHDIVDRGFYMFRVPQRARAAVPCPTFAFRHIEAACIQLARGIDFKVRHDALGDLVGTHNDMHMVVAHVNG